jgi:hypothetical protein
MKDNYHYVRFRWWNPANLQKIEEKLREYSFNVKKIADDKTEQELSIYKDNRKELLVRADNVKARISYYTASLEQQEGARFSSRDMKLREIILSTYSRERATPFPWGFNEEPRFELEK